MNRAKEPAMDQVSDNLLFKTFEHLDLKSLDACRLVCRRWASMINSQDFQKSFHARPNTQPRLTLTFCYKSNRFRSFSSSPHVDQEPHESFVSRRSRLPPVGYDCVHGLICQGSTIINPSLGIECDLPLISSTDGEERRILGFDPKKFCHKLLALRVDHRTGLGDYQVHTLGDNPKTWRILHSAPPDLPVTNSVCIDGTVYYFTISQPGTCSMVRFNVAAETIEFFDVPDQASHSVGKHLDRPNTVLEYKSKFGFVSLLPDDRTFGLWVLNDVEKQLWTKLSFSLDQQRVYRSMDLGAMSFDRDTGEIVLAASDMGWTIYLVFIDVDTNATRRIVFPDCKALTRRGFAIREYRESTVLL